MGKECPRSEPDGVIRLDGKCGQELVGWQKTASPIPNSHLPIPGYTR